MEENLGLNLTTNFCTSKISAGNKHHLLEIGFQTMLGMCSAAELIECWFFDCFAFERNPTQKSAKSQPHRNTIITSRNRAAHGVCMWAKVGAVVNGNKAIFGWYSENYFWLI